MMDLGNKLQNRCSIFIFYNITKQFLEDVKHQYSVHRYNNATTGMGAALTSGYICG